MSSAPKGKPGSVWVGNYQVTDIPVFRTSGGASGVAQLVDPSTGTSVPIPNMCLANASWQYGGSQWALIQGDTLDVMLHSNLDYSGKTSVPLPVNGSEPCRASNLHTHGLLVSPYHPAKAGAGPYGDYVLDATQPHGSIDYKLGFDDCGTQLGDVPHRGHGLTDMPLHYVTTIPGQAGVSSLKSGEHPSGLFWFHPHPHGFSQFQLHGGTTGAITIGALTDYACPTGDGTPGNCTITDTNIRVMILKDQAIQAPDGQTWSTIHDNESALCTPTGGGNRYGECEGAEGKGPLSKWIFTVNGVQYPVMHDPAGRMEIWRIANTSPSMTYDLSIDPFGDSGIGSLPFQLLAKDGVAVLQQGEGPKMHTHMLLMPANRIEIAIPAPPTGGTYVLRNNAVSTAADGNTTGNIWPQIDLARIVWDAPKGDEAQSNQPPRQVAVSAPSTPLPAGNTSTALPPACRYDPTDTRVINFVHRFVTIYGTDKAPGVFKKGVNEVFGLIAGIRHADGTFDYYPEDGGAPLHDLQVVWKLGVKGFDKAFPALGHNNYNTICTVKGNVEHWELQNWTGEDHNFHIHQSKFTIDPSGVFQFPQPRQGDLSYLKVTDSLIRNFIDPKERTFNDTVPVPRGQSICNTEPQTPGCLKSTATQCSGEPEVPSCARPGQMSVLMDFSRAEQVGTFVYHCHILEHEDGGMMAQINVICPPGDPTCAGQQANAAICKPPAGL